MTMDQYTLRVMMPDRETPVDEGTDAVKESFGRLFTEVCRNIVGGELRLQGEVPPELYVDVGVMDDRDLARDARRLTDGALDYLGGGAGGTWMDDTFPDVMGRKRIAVAVLDLATALEGRSLMHGPEGSETYFDGVDQVRIGEMAHALVRAYNGGLMGVVVKDPSRRDHWALVHGGRLVPLVFRPGTSRYDIEDYASAGPVIVTGTVVLDEGGAIAEMRAIENCYTFHMVVFLRGISEGRDLGLVAPLEAQPGYYNRTGRWMLRSPDLGIESSGGTWDECVIGFHRSFVDLWRSHAEGTAEANARIRGMLEEMHGFRWCWPAFILLYQSPLQGDMKPKNMALLAGAAVIVAICLAFSWIYLG